jgi:hypothetical protein
MQIVTLKRFAVTSLDVAPILMNGQVKVGEVEEHLTMVQRIILNMGRYEF